VILPAQALLFDNDGVLSDSVATVDACWQRWANLYGLDAGAVAGIHGKPARESIAALLPNVDTEEAFEVLEDLEVAAAVDTKPMPGALDLLDGLPRDRWIVVTSGTPRLAIARLHHIGIDPPAMITADDVPRGKPDPAPYLAAAAALGFDPTACLVFEDTTPGIQSARQAGATVIGIGHHAQGAEYRIHDLREVRATETTDGLVVTIG
jgi:sugar-phosphatase